MGLLNSVLGALLGPEGIEGRDGALQAIVAMLAEDGEHGGLAGLVQRLQGGGLGEAASSWIGTGPNLGVSAEQLQSVLGGDWIERFAQQLGQHPGEAVQTLSPLLFPSKKKPEKPRELTTAWRNATVKAGLMDFRFHDLRHSAASYLAMSGATVPELAAVLGHKTLQMVQRYAHLSPAHTRAVPSA